MVLQSLISLLDFKELAPYGDFNTKEDVINYAKNRV